MELEKIEQKIVELKKLHKIDTVYTISVDDKVCFLKKPNRVSVAKAMPLLVKEDIITAGEILLRENFIDGDKEFLTDDSFILAASLQVVQIVEIKTAELKKN